MACAMFLLSMIFYKLSLSRSKSCALLISHTFFSWSCVDEMFLSLASWAANCCKFLLLASVSCWRSSVRKLCVYIPLDLAS